MISAAAFFFSLGGFSLIYFCYTVVASVAMGMVDAFGGGATGWKIMALVFALVALGGNCFSVLMVKELPEEENTENDSI